MTDAPLTSKQEVASPDIQRIVEALATGFKLRIEDQGGFDGYEVWIEKREGFRCPVSIEQLLRMGVIEPHPTNAVGWQLTDKWHRAYMRSTDELRDGKLYVPRPADETKAGPHDDGSDCHC